MSPSWLTRTQIRGRAPETGDSGAEPCVRWVILMQMAIRLR